MINTTSTLGGLRSLGVLRGLAKLGTVVCLSLVMASCGFHLQGQNQQSFPPQLNLYVDDPILGSMVASDLSERQVALELLESVVDADTTAPTLQLTRTLKHRSELILDTNGDALIWRYTLSSQYLLVAAGVQPETEQALITPGSLLISVTTDVDLGGGKATVNERIESESWALLYKQLATRITRQLSFE